ncbi:hypothetical protein AK830_g4400 [Neonectria ditissima]|uniref:Fatty acid hydroxylase domain-containing protein n=1 Tax=Neonectria ditissima TaxID=78410 RepID=A0A0P7B6H5_9HYPO|nr:hypothetical protein AK830_g4400 [Neonectria ditissima]
MDILLSLPIATYLLAPSSPSWSTSLNLLFFYMTWTTLILSHSPLKIRLVGTLAIRAALWLAPSLLSLLFDLALPSLAEPLKFGGRSALPPRALARPLALALANLAALSAADAACSALFAALSGSDDFRASSALPLPWLLAKHVLLLLAARELLVYLVHRPLLHGRDSLVARLHARYAHARAAAPYSLQLMTDHPLPLLLHRFVPVYLPALLLRPHLLTYFLFLALCTAEETLAMSGYSVVPGIIMGGITRRCAIHYASGGTANYGAWGLLDWASGTSRGGDVLEDVKAEADKHQLKRRSVKKADSGASAIQNGIEALRNGGGNGPRRSPRTRSNKRAS